MEAVSLGTAISEQNKGKSPSDMPITGAVDYAIRAKMREDALKEKNRIAQQAHQDKMDADFQHLLNTVSFEGIHEKVLPGLKEDVLPLMDKAGKLNPNDINTYAQRESLINEAKRRVQEAKVQSEVLKHYEAIPNEHLSQTALAQKEDYNNTPDIRTLKTNGLNKLTGEGFSANGTPVAEINKFANLNDEMDKHFRASGQAIKDVAALNGYTAQVNSEFTPENSRKIAEKMWEDPNIRNTYLNSNTEYVNNKYLKQIEGQSGVAKPNELYRNNGIVQEDLKHKFINDVTEYATTKNKQTLRSIPQINTNSGTGNPFKDNIKETTQTIDPTTIGKFVWSKAPDGMYYIGNKVPEKPAKFVAVSKSNGKPNEILINSSGKKILERGYWLNEKGDIIGVAGSQYKETGVDDNNKPIYKISPEENIPLSETDLGSVAVQHKFSDKHGGKEAFKSWLNGQKAPLIKPQTSQDKPTSTKELTWAQKQAAKNKK